jgi:hypothetical protein
MQIAGQARMPISGGVIRPLPLISLFHRLAVVEAGS